MPVQVQSAARAADRRSSPTRPVHRLRRRRGLRHSTPTARWCRALLARGVYPPPSQFEAWFPSLAHGREHVERTVDGRGRGVRGAGRRDEPRGAARGAAGRGGTAATAGRCAGPRDDAGRRRRRPTPARARRSWRPRGPRASGREARVRAAARDDPRGLAAALRRAAGGRAPTIPTWRCCSATSSTRSGLARLAELGDLEAVAELADLISLVAQAQAACDAELADAVWQAGAAAIGWGIEPPSTRRPRRWREPATRAPRRRCTARRGRVLAAAGGPRS